MCNSCQQFLDKQWPTTIAPILQLLFLDKNSEFKKKLIDLIEKAEQDLEEAHDNKCKN